jgi:signal transduction histidine kinase
MTVEERIEELRRIELVGALSDERLRWIAERADPRVFEPGDAVFTEGAMPSEFFFLLDGRVETTSRIGGPDGDGDEASVVLHRPYTFLGAISLLNGLPYPGTSRVAETTRVLALGEDDFNDLIRDEPSVRRTVLRSFQPVFERWGQIQGQREKLAALGELSAGLAHELNNPASAAGRAAHELAAALAAVQAGVGRLAERGVTPQALAKLSRVAARAREAAADAEDVDALDRSDREDEVAAVLSEHGVPDPWDLAGDLVEVGLDQACAKAVAASVEPGVAAEALVWVAAGARAEALARELSEATGRIATLVGAVKEYSYMDQAPSQDVDVNRGIKTTLTVLLHKLKQGDVRISKQLDPDLPPIHAYGSELNQVWTNLLDNAIDAVDGDGTISIRTARDGDAVLVQITDDGPGIPEDVRSRIFEPFFTTKDVGSGTGLGLDVAWRIVVQRHHGDIRVDSRPGETRFTVRLPRDGVVANGGSS